MNTISAVLEKLKAEKREKSTRQSLRKIPNVACLYRHEVYGSYYGVKKHNGKIRTKALVTENGQNITDRKIAESALREWMDELTNPTTEAKITFAELFQRYEKTADGLAAATKKKIQWVKDSFKRHWPEVFPMQVVAIKPSDVATFFAACASLAPRSYNDLSRITMNLFRLAVDDGILKHSPFDKVQAKRKKVVSAPDEVPTIEQCEKIVAHVRGQEFADTAEQTGDFLELIHRTALGTAEVIYLQWRNVDWAEGVLRIRRRKTGEHFIVPIYPYLRPFLAELYERQGKPPGSHYLVSIKSPKKALYNACRRMKLPPYSPRDLRKARITWMIRKGVPHEWVANWQGHRDGGVLIRRTYSYVKTDADKTYEQQQLAKLV